MAANALNAQVDATVRLVGPLVGGALLGLVGLSGLILVDSLTFLASASLIALIARRPRPRARLRRRGLGPRRRDRAALDRPPVGRPGPEWRAGLAMVAADPVLSATFVVVAAVALADGVANVLFVPYFRQVLGAGPAELGWMISVTGLARVDRPLADGPPARARRAGAARRPRHRRGRPDRAVFAAAPPLPLLLLGMLVLTPPIPGINVGIDRDRAGPRRDAFRGRALGAMGAASALLTLIGMAASSLAGTAVPVVALMAASGLLYLAAAAAAARCCCLMRPDAQR